jgi:preprotein translocase subunit SecG
MSRLPPPPRFTLPPPPMPSLDIFNTKILSQLTCSSIRQHHQETMTSSRLILLASATIIVAILLFIITLICLLLSRKQKQSYDNSKSKPHTSLESMNDLSTCSSRSYETVSSDHTGVYLESINTSATTCSTDVTGVICTECYRHRVLQPAPYYHILNIPDVIPN